MTNLGIHMNVRVCWNVIDEEARNIRENWQKYIMLKVIDVVTELLAGGS